MYTMKETCALVGMSYETLKFYCRSGLVPNLCRDERNRRIFDDRNIAWINSLNCLRACGMGIDEMRKYMELCLEGETTVPERQRILAEKRRILMQRMEESNTASTISMPSRPSTATSCPGAPATSAI